MKKINITIDWSVVFWISITILFLWLLAKAVGLINSPWFIEVIPAVVGFFALIGVGKGIAKYTYKMDEAFMDIKDIKKEVHSLDKRLTVVESKM